jgi:hypothetical protein
MLVEELNRLDKEEFSISVEDSVVEITTMDLPARANVLCMTHHNGEFSCLYCTIPGEVVASGAGHCRSFPALKNAVHSARTGETVRKNAEDALEHGDHCLGFRGKSVLMYVPHFGSLKMQMMLLSNWRSLPWVQGEIRSDVCSPF